MRRERVGGDKGVEAIRAGRGRRAEERQKPNQPAGGLGLEIQPIGRFRREPACNPRTRAAFCRTSSSGPSK